MIGQSCSTRLAPMPKLPVPAPVGHSMPWRARRSRILPALATKASRCCSSGADLPNAAKVDHVESREDRGHERSQIPHAVGSGTKERNAQRAGRDALLELASLWYP